MGTNNQKEVDLIIRAKDMSAQALKDSKKAVDEVTSSLDKQAQQAKTTGQAVDGLGRSSSSLSDSQKNLAKSADTLEKTLNSTAAALDNAKERQGSLNQELLKANDNLDRHKRSIEGAALAYQVFARDALSAGPPTKATARELDKLAAAAQGGGRELERLTARASKISQDFQGAQSRAESLTRSMGELRALESEVASASQQVSKAMTDQAAAMEAAATAKERFSAREQMAQARGQAIIQAGQRDAAAAEKERQAAQASADRDFAARLARIREAAAAETAAVSKSLSGQTSQANGVNAVRSAEAAANAERAKSVSLIDKITTGNRESLSWYQRVRGELVAMATAYVGVQGAINLALGALDAARKFNSAESILAVAAGTTDPKAVSAEYAYVAGQAERLGIRVDDLAASYGRFAVASKAAGATTNQTRFIFEKVAESARVLHMSTDDMKGTFLAIEQMMSKGQVQAEELRGQLGDRLPAAFSLFAKAMGISLPELNKQLKAGTVSVKALLGFAQQLGDEYGKQLPMAIQNMQAAEARLYNALYEFKRNIADMGFADAWTKFANNLTKTLRSDDGKEFARKLSDGFSTAISILEAVVKNINLVADAVALVFGVKVLASIAGFTIKLTEAAFAMSSVGAASAASAPAVGAAAGSMAGATAASEALAAALRRINQAFVLVSSAFAGWEIGQILGEKFEMARLAGTAAAESIYQAWIHMKYDVLIVASEMTEGIVNLFDKGLRKLGELKNGFLGHMRDAAAFLGLDNLAASIGDSISTGVKTGAEESKKTLAAATNALKAQRDKELAQNKSAFDVLYQGDLRHKGARLARTPAAATSLTDTTGGLYDIPNPGKGDKTTQKRESMEVSLSEKLNALWKSVEKNYSDNLDMRLEAVKRTYKNIYDEIVKYEKLGGKSIDGQSIASIKAQIEQIKAQAIQQETLKFNTEQLKKKEEEVNDVLKERTEFQKDVLEQVKARTITAAAGFKRIADENDRIQPKLAQMAKDAEKFANAVRGTGIPDAKIDAFVQKMQRVGNDPSSGAASAAGKGGLELFNQQMAETNNLLEERNAYVAMYASLVKLGAVTQEDANEKVKAMFGETAPKIKSMLGDLQKLIDAMAASGDISGSKLDALNAKLKEISTQTQYVDKDMAALRETFTKGLADGATKQLGNVVDQLLAAADGTQKWSDAFKNILSSFGQFIAQFLRQMADAILQIYATKLAMSLLSSLGGFGGGGGGGGGTGLGSWGLGGDVPAAIAHSGQVVGQSGGVSRNASAAWFANAPRYHSGTIVGLNANEQTAILEKGEEVLSKDNPRNIMNMTAKNAATAAAKGPMAIRNVLVTDPNFVPDAMASAQGEQTLITMVSRNRVGFRKALGV